MSIRNKDFYAEDYSRLENELESVKAERDELKRKLEVSVEQIAIVEAMLKRFVPGTSIKKEGHHKWTATGSAGSASGDSLADCLINAGFLDSSIIYPDCNMQPEADS